jgi:putative colanic acid biosynthesis acetyltransferase WcaF
MRLDKYSSHGFDRGRSRLVEGLWIVVQALLVSSWLPGSWHRIKPGVLVKFPWRLSVGEWSWLGECAWIDNLAEVEIGSHAVISQQAYLCTGSHDARSESFDLVVRPITVGNSAWICAGSVVGPGTVVGNGAILALGSVAIEDLEPWTIYRGNPAVAIGRRPGGAE